MKFRSRLAESTPHVTKVRGVDGWYAFNANGEVDSSIEGAPFWVTGHGEVTQHGGLRLIVQVNDTGVSTACRNYGIPTVKGTQKVRELLGGMSLAKYRHGQLRRAGSDVMQAVWEVESEVPGLDLQHVYNEMQPKLNHLAQALTDWVEASATADHT